MDSSTSQRTTRFLTEHPVLKRIPEDVRTDIVQETMAVLVRRFDHLSAEALEGVALAVARLILRGQQRKWATRITGFEKSVALLLQEETSRTADPAEKVEADELRATIRQALYSSMLRVLTSQEREIIRKHFLSSTPVSALASSRKDQQATYYAIRRALAKLRIAMSQYRDDWPGLF